MGAAVSEIYKTTAASKKVRADSLLSLRVQEHVKGMGERSLKQEELHAVDKGPLQLLSKGFNEYRFSCNQGETRVYNWKGATLCV